VNRSYLDAVKRSHLPICIYRYLDSSFADHCWSSAGLPGLPRLGPSIDSQMIHSRQRSFTDRSVLHRLSGLMMTTKRSLYMKKIYKPVIEGMLMGIAVHLGTTTIVMVTEKIASFCGHVAVSVAMRLLAGHSN
jgi:hypothetical protein